MCRGGCQGGDQHPQKAEKAAPHIADISKQGPEFEFQTKQDGIPGQEKKNPVKKQCQDYCLEGQRQVPRFHNQGQNNLNRREKTTPLQLIMCQAFLSLTVSYYPIKQVGYLAGEEGKMQRLNNFPQVIRQSTSGLQFNSKSHSKIQVSSTVSPSAFPRNKVEARKQHLGSTGFQL